ncbi:hypothetical protein BJ742DRAFT_49828 [Cladochytrium replicatum]|nr:hypothetical protein BJ742DRAFT_49828 [Cladochytrium replicatum]
MTIEQEDAVVGFTPDEFERGINLIFHIAVGVIPLNIAGSIYVLFRVLSVTFRSRPRVVPVSLRLPFYIVFLDLLCSFSYITEMVHLYLARRQPTQPYSAIFGGLITFVIVSNFILITNAAFFSWNRVVRKRPVDNGPYDAKLVGPAILVPIAIVAVLGSIGALGANNYICWIRKSAYGAALFLVICTLSSMIALWFFYVHIMFEVFKVSRGSFLSTAVSFRPTKSTSIQAFQPPLTRQGDQTSRIENNGAVASDNMRSESSQLSIVEKQIIAKICMYMLACFIQYLPGIPFATSFLFPTQPYILYVMAVVSINLGGVINATALILNEGLGRIAKSQDGSYYPASSGEGTSSVGALGSGPVVGNTTVGTNSWGRVPSFKGILVNSQSPQIDIQIPDPFYGPRSDQRGHIHPILPSSSHAHISSYDKIWELNPGPSPYPTDTRVAVPLTVYPPVPSVFNSHQVPVTRLPSRRSSQQSSNPATVVDVAANSVAEAYANMARYQQNLNGGR